MKNLFLFLIVLALLISSGFIASSKGEWWYYDSDKDKWTTADYVKPMVIFADSSDEDFRFKNKDAWCGPMGTSSPVDTNEGDITIYVLEEEDGYYIADIRDFIFIFPFGEIKISQEDLLELINPMYSKRIGDLCIYAISSDLHVHIPDTEEPFFISEEMLLEHARYFGWQICNQKHCHKDKVDD